jgi:hypothetical protein
MSSRLTYFSALLDEQLKSEMALDNLHCPQFVDFTNPTFDTMDDGADKYFENGVVGDEIDLGFGLADDPWKKEAKQIQQSKADAKQQHNKKDSGISLNQTPTKAAIPKETQATKLTKTSSIKRPVQTKTSTYRQRTNSTCSTSSRTATHNSSIVNKSTATKSTNQNIVKKTLAKVTAAFKPTLAINPKPNEQFRIFSSGTNSTNKKLLGKHGPMKVEHNLNASQASSKSTKRRCSSVPRTINLTANQPSLPKTQITLGEKIHNFFSRDKMATTGAPVKSMFSMTR